MPQTDSRDAAGWAAMVPPWLMSLAAHLLLAIFGSLAVRGFSASKFYEDEPLRPGEIVLVQREANRNEYFADQQAETRHNVFRPVTGEAAGGALDGSGRNGGANGPPLLSGIALPQFPGGVTASEALVAAPQIGGSRGPARLAGNPLDEAAILAEDALIPREKIPTGPTAQLSLFGSASAEGRSFAFVIDHSNSMGGDGLGAIQAAAKELAAHIDRLSAEQTFQVVAYNEAVAYLSGRELIPASNENKRKLVSYVANLAAFGQTEHSRGLLAALRLKPEVIFLFTDGGDPPLNPGQLRTIREAAGRTSIHCLHFGRGPKPDSGVFLSRLAAENRGSYVYIDLNNR